MEITVLKCDRCKKKVDGLIEFSFINRNIPREGETTKGENLGSLWDYMRDQSHDKKYPTVQGGLCLDCVMEISRWLGHQENILLETVK